MYTVTRKYRFYAAHRNQLLNDKCKNLHGHTYNVEVSLRYPVSATKDGVTMLFADIDASVAPIINKYDHAFLLDKNDKLSLALRKHETDTGEDLKVVIFHTPTSAENLAKRLYEEIWQKLPNISAVTVKETESSIVRYAPNDQASLSF